MWQGSTPILTFNLPLDFGGTQNIKSLCVAFGQGCNTVLEKHLEDCVLYNNYFTLKLSQTDTMRLTACRPLQCQVKILDMNEMVFESDFHTLEVKPSLCKEVLE